MQPVTEAAFANMVAYDQRHIRTFFEQLLESGVKPFVISGPWPVRTHPIMVDTGVRPDIVHAVDARARALFMEWLSEREIDFVAPPAGTADETGLLKDEYAKGGDDPCHGNFRYGKRMMAKVLSERLGLNPALAD